MLSCRFFHVGTCALILGVAQGPSIRVSVISPARERPGLGSLSFRVLPSTEETQRLPFFQSHIDFSFPFCSACLWFLPPLMRAVQSRGQG